MVGKDEFKEYVSTSVAVTIIEILDLVEFVLGMHLHVIVVIEFINNTRAGIEG